MRSGEFTSFAKATSCTTGTWKRSGWTASHLKRIPRTPLGNRWNVWSRNESTRVQESSNEDHVAGVGPDCASCSEPDSDKRSASGARRARGARESGGEGWRGTPGSAGERPIRIHHLSPQREPLCARPERSGGG